MAILLLLIPIAYLLGSVPFGLLIANAHGKDLRCIGSGNIGATNVSRALGKRWAYLCFVLDCLKGLLPMIVAGGFINDITVSTLSLWLAVGCASIAGHIFSIYLKFRGGKGVATGLGMVLGLYPYYTVAGGAAFVVWVIFVLALRYISLASIAGAVAFPVALVLAIAFNAEWEFARLWPLVIIAVIMPLLVVGRHAENIKRLLEGTENKVFQKNLK